MSLATIDLAPTHHFSPQRLRKTPSIDLATTPTPLSTQPSTPPHITLVPEGPEARGFVLYVGVDESKVSAAGTDLSTLVSALKNLTSALVPESESYAAVAFAPRASGGRDVDVVRLALQDPTALARHRDRTGSEPEEPTANVVVDLSRKRVVIDGTTVPLTYLEFELLQFLVLRPGVTISREELLDSLWSTGDEESPNERTIDVHVRRLRAKLRGYEEIVRTVRGSGYRFDRHADVSVRHASTPSPDF